MTHVTVHQITSINTHGAFLNVNAMDGWLEVWGSTYKQPTYLLFEGIRFHLVTFDTREYADEWMEQYKSRYTKIIEVDVVE
jgi:hypothetical protein